MAPAPDNLSPAGSSQYSSNTMYVGDGTWDATRNDFLLPNLVGLNFDTMRYNGTLPSILFIQFCFNVMDKLADRWICGIGMGNRFAGLPQYHQIIKGHAVIAVITFLFIVPAAIMTARFYGRSPGWALRFHIYLQVLTVLLSTVVFTLGWFAVGPERSLTNPHHGIGLAIYVLILVQAIGGRWIYGREKGRTRRKLPIKLVIHQWLGRAIALLGIAQVPLGLTLYGSPKFTFVLYTLWMTFLLVLYFILSYRALAPIGALLSEGRVDGVVIEEKRRSRFGGILGPLAAGGGAALLLNRLRNRDRSRDRSRSRSRSRVEVIPSRRGSGSFIEEEKFEDRREGGGFVDKLLKGAAVVGAGALAKSWYDRRQRRKEEDYSSVAPDTPSRRNRLRRRNDSELSDSVVEDGLRPGTGPILPGPGNPVAAAAALSAAEPRPITPRPRPARTHSIGSETYSYDSTLSPSRRPQESRGLRNGLLAGLGLGWFAKRMADRRSRKEQDRLDALEEEHRIEEERIARQGNTPGGPRYTGDGFPSGSRRHGRRGSRTQSSDLSSVIDDPHHIRPGGIPPIPASLAAGAAGAALAGQSRSRHDITEQVVMPPPPPDPQGVLHQDIDSGSEQYMSAGGHPHRRHSSRRRREGEAAAAAAVAGAATLAAEEEARRRRSRSRGQSVGHSGGEGVASPPVSVKVKVHGDRDRNVTLRRLTEEEAAAEREARRGGRRNRRRADSLSSLSGTDTATSNRRYRRERREADEIAAEKRAEAGMPPPPAIVPLSPPNPAFAGGRRPKDSAYYSGRPGEAGPSGSGYVAGPPGSVGSPESHGTWSAMSPGSTSRVGSGGEDPAERRRRRRLERNQRTQGTVDYT